MANRYHWWVLSFTCFISELSGSDIKVSRLLVTVKHDILVRWGAPSGFLSLWLSLLTVSPEQHVLPLLWPRAPCSCAVHWLSLCASALFSRRRQEALQHPLLCSSTYSAVSVAMFLLWMIAQDAATSDGQRSVTKRLNRVLLCDTHCLPKNKSHTLLFR